MKSLAIIIGKAPEKYSEDSLKSEIVTWHVDLEINSAIEISRQQAFIAFNFLRQHFEIKNLSEEHEIYVNGRSITSYDDPLPLESSDVVQIGSEDFIFLLPLDSNLNLRTKRFQKEQQNVEAEGESENLEQENEEQQELIIAT